MTMICSHRNPGRCGPHRAARHCGTVRSVRDAGAPGDECGFAECVWLLLRMRGAVGLGLGARNCPNRWVQRGKRRVQEGERRQSVEGEGASALGARTTTFYFAKTSNK